MASALLPDVFPRLAPIAAIPFSAAIGRAFPRSSSAIFSTGGSIAPRTLATTNASDVLALVVALFETLAEAAIFASQSFKLVSVMPRVGLFKLFSAALGFEFAIIAAI